MNVQKTGINLRMLTAAGVMAALVFIFTWVIHIPAPVSGYIHIGDSVIYCAGYLLGGFYAAAAAGIGSMLADLLAGYPMYMLGTLIIKGLMGFVCAVIITRPKFSRFLVACITGGAIMAVGYFFYDLLFLGGLPYAWGNILFSLIQWAGGVLVALPLFKAVKEINAHLNIRGELARGERR